ncbi:MAG: DUF308 domain-containing protein [Flavonifractor plautii]
MREFFHNMKLSFLLAAVLYVILGLVLLIWPGVSATVFCYAFGGILLIYGVVTIGRFFLRDSRKQPCSSSSSVSSLRPWAAVPAPPGHRGLRPARDPGPVHRVDGLVNPNGVELRRCSISADRALVLSAVLAVLGLVIVFQPFLAAEALVSIGAAHLRGLSDRRTISR